MESDFPEYESHEAANLFPMEEETLQELADDIKANGQHVAVEIYCGKIIDGRRRYAACRLAGVIPKTKIVSVADPIAYVISLNLHRRQLTQSQKAMVAADAREMYDRQAKERQVRKSADSVPETLPEQTKGDSRDKAGEAVGVSGKMVDHARTVKQHGVPELVDAVKEGRISVTRAAKVASEPAEVQRKEAESAKFTGGRFRRKDSTEETTHDEPESQPVNENRRRPKGVDLANQAINCLSQIPKKDPLRNEGFKMVTDWIKSQIKEYR